VQACANNFNEAPDEKQEDSSTARKWQGAHELLLVKAAIQREPVEPGASLN
jgi:hypothetical protein